MIPNITIVEIEAANRLGLRNVDAVTLDLIRYALKRFDYIDDAVSYCRKVLVCN